MGARAVSLALASWEDRIKPRSIGEIFRAARRELVRSQCADSHDPIGDGASGHASNTQRRRREYVGVGPKWVLQRYRLHEANERLKANPSIELAGLALELGYVEQAHFVRDFTAVVGVTPGAYARRVSGR